MSKYKVEILPFDNNGAYQTDWIDVTDDVGALGSFSIKLDNDEYNTGTFKNSTMSVTFANETGKYSEVGETTTIFRYTRSNSQIRISWNKLAFPPIIGTAILGDAVLAADDTVIVSGLLSDESFATDIQNQQAKFKILGKEGIFSQVETPYSSISVSDSFETVLYTILNQSSITDLLTISASNINVGTNQLIDSKDDWENTTVEEVLSEVLEMSGSVLYIKDNIVYVKERSQAGLLSSLTLYGQASDDGPENIQKLTNIRTGLNKTYNYWTWEETTELSSDATSAIKNGVRKKEIGYSTITNTTKISAILDYNLAEFKDLKEELEVTVLASNETLEAEILSGVTVDYPTVYRAAEGEDIPLYGASYYGTAVYPFGEYTKTISTDTIYKLMGKKYNLKNDLITYYLREK